MRTHSRTHARTKRHHHHTHTSHTVYVGRVIDRIPAATTNYRTSSLRQPKSALPEDQANPVSAVRNAGMLPRNLTEGVLPHLFTFRRRAARGEGGDDQPCRRASLQTQRQHRMDNRQWGQTKAFPAMRVGGLNIKPSNQLDTIHLFWSSTNEES